MKCNLMLHCGASAVNRAVLEAAPTPEPTDTWQPIPHYQLLTTVESALQQAGLRVVEQAHGLTHDSQRYFGLLQVANGEVSDEYGWVLGLRNSSDKKFPAGVCIGSQVFVCDNLAFSGEIQVARKHTRFVLRDLPYMVGQAINRLRDIWKQQDERVAAYKKYVLSDVMAHDLTIRALDARVICGEKIPGVLQEWRKPRHDAFLPRTLWSFFNAVTENIKGNLHVLPRRTEGLYEICNTRIDA
jgi:Domain of unknown function (DUF932)